MFKEMEASEYHWSKGSEGGEAGDEGRETGSGQLLRAWEALSRTLEFTEYDLHFSVEEGGEGAGGVRIWFAFSTDLSGC